MDNFSFPERQINTDGWKSPSFLVSTAALYRRIKMRLGSSEWTSITGTVDFGVEISNDNGKTWINFASVKNVTIGWIGKKGGLPSFGVTSIELVGKLARVFIKPSVNIKLSISGEVI